jgi:hypothetical protein
MHADMNITTTPTTERRIAQRRQGEKDRRQMIRFEMDKTPRRTGNDRRVSDFWKGRDKF